MTDAKDYGEELLFETLIVRLFPDDKKRLEAIVKNNQDKFDTVSHAARCALQEFIKKWGDLDA